MSHRTRGQAQRTQIVAGDSFWRTRWNNIEAPATAIIEDTLLFLILIAGVTIVYLALVGLALLGYNPERIEMFETIHYWAYLVIFTLFMLDLVVRMVLHTFRKKP